MKPAPAPAVTIGVSLAGLLVALLLAGQNLALPWVVLGRSMTPTLEPGDRIVVDLWTLRQRAPRPGELILFRGPAPEQRAMIKRVGTPPGFPDNRPRRRQWPEATRVLEPGIWLLGDNATDSDDSRHFGPVPLDRVIGRVALRYWPLSRSGGGGLRSGVSILFDVRLDVRSISTHVEL